VVTYLCKLFGHHNGMEDVLQVCGNRSSIPSSSPPIPSLALIEVDPLIAGRGSGERFSSPAGPSGARPPNGIW